MTILDLYALCENMSQYTVFHIHECGVKITEATYGDYPNRYALSKIKGFKHVEPNLWDIFY